MSLYGLISKPVKDIFRFGKYLLPFFFGLQFFKHPLCQYILLNAREFRCLLEGFFKQPRHNSPLFLSLYILSCIVCRGKATQKLFRQDITAKLTGATSGASGGAPLFVPRFKALDSCVVRQKPHLLDC